MSARSHHISIMRWLALPAAVLLLWLHSYFALRVFSHDGRVLLLALRANESTEDWLRRNPPTAETWENLRPDKVKGLAGVVILREPRPPKIGRSTDGDILVTGE